MLSQCVTLSYLAAYNEFIHEFRTVTEKNLKAIQSILERLLENVPAQDNSPIVYNNKKICP